MGSSSTASRGSSLLRALALTLAATAVAGKTSTKSAKAAAATKANTIEIVGLTGVSGRSTLEWWGGPGGMVLSPGVGT